MEVWRTCVYDGVVYDNYEVSSDGENVRNIKTGKMKKQQKINSGYLTVSLHKNGKSKNCLVHRLVAFTFPELVPNDDPINKIWINHKNEDKTSNAWTNLEWCTPEYNSNFGTGLQRMKQTKKENPHIFTEEERKVISDRMTGEKHPLYGTERSDETKKKISQTRLEKGIGRGENNPRARKVICLETKQVFGCAVDAGKWCGKDNSSISRCCNGKQKTCGGFHWEYVD